mmetsp:Transcript_9800/g.24927  ORF Transcript_9800/g.24927 Transcript_9800/m.24927 type:complete len:98 (-) Transcript_9800:23-316(-)
MYDLQPGLEAMPPRTHLSVHVPTSAGSVSDTMLPARLTKGLEAELETSLAVPGVSEVKRRRERLDGWGADASKLERAGRAAPGSLLVPPPFSSPRDA